MLCSTYDRHSGTRGRGVIYCSNWNSLAYGTYQKTKLDRWDTPFIIHHTIVNIIRIERCWANLENYWNGAILSTADTALEWASNMKWKGHTPVVHLVERVYEKGIKVCQEVLEELKELWQRSETLPKWDVVVQPT
jgi:hypothetical protein